MLPEPSRQQKMKENEFKSPLKVPVMARDAAPDPSAGVHQGTVWRGVRRNRGKGEIPTITISRRKNRGVNPVQPLNTPKGACRRFWVLPFPKTPPGLQMAPSHQGCR